MPLTNAQVQNFNSFLTYFNTNFGRHTLPWRQTTDPYHIWISEIMLQQTQVDRVIPKYNAFINRYPSVTSLSQATWPDVMQLWDGLGYNRRARHLWEASQQLVLIDHDHFPTEYDQLIQLKGIGDYTAKAILTFAYNQPVTLIETNVRTVFLYHFFPNHTDIHDSQIIPLIDQTLDRHQPRTWYSTLMDYGTYLKKSIGNPNHRSQHYTKQTTFAGSDRQLRAQIIKYLLTGPKTDQQLTSQFPDPRLKQQLSNLIQEHMITYLQGIYRLA